MTEKSLRAALIGAGGFAARTLGALCRCEKVQLTGLSDRQARAAEAAAAEAGCPAYSDHRRLLVETRPQAAFLAIPPAGTAELIRLAAREKLHVWQRAPLARSLPQAIQLCRLMDRAAGKFAIGTQRRFMTTYRRAKTALDRLGKVYLVRAHYFCNSGPNIGWRGDKAGGGGALMELGYHLFDLVIWLLGMPETIYSVLGAVPAEDRPMDQPVYDTEDSFAAICRYRADAAATVVASRCFNPVSEGVNAYCEGGWVAADPTRCVVRDRQGTVLESIQADQTPATVFAGMIDEFVDAAIDSHTHRYEASAWENILTMAAMEAAKLSDQTNQPEALARLLRNYDITPADCLKDAPGHTEPAESD